MNNQQKHVYKLGILRKSFHPQKPGFLPIQQAYKSLYDNSKWAVISTK